MAKHLAVVRCGDRSLHPAWCAGERDWDLGVSYFGPDADKPFPEARYVHRKKAGKWDGIFDFFTTHPEAVDAYDYFWLPDDDILTDAATISHLFALMSEYKLEVAQPSLSRESYFSHLVTLQNSAFKLRFTNFVEIMAPVVSRGILKQVLPLFERTRSGFGIDFVWARLMDDPSFKTAIIDELCVTHTRPVGGPLHRTAKPGETADDELGALLSDVGPTSNSQSLVNGQVVPRILVYGGVTKDGRWLKSPAQTALPQLAGHLDAWGQIREPSATVPAILRHYAKHLMSPKPDLSRIETPLN